MTTDSVSAAEGASPRQAKRPAKAPPKRRPEAPSNDSRKAGPTFPDNGPAQTPAKDAPGQVPVKDQLVAARTRSALLGRPGFLIRRLHQIHISLFLAETEAFGITPVQYSLLTALDQHGELDQNTVALEVGLERTTVAEVIPRLETRGYLERRQSESDRRVKLVKLSRKGRLLVRRMETAVQRAHDRTIDHLPPEDRERFLLYLIQLVEAKNDHGSVPFRLP